MEELHPLWIWLGKELLNYEPVFCHNIYDFKKKVKTALHGKVLHLLEEVGQNEPPIDPEPLAKIRKAKILKLPFESDGMLVPTNEGFTIKINSNLHSVK